MTRYLSISAALIAAMLALAACDRASTATSDPGDILLRINLRKSLTLPSAENTVR